MVKKINLIKSKNSKITEFNLNCKNFGIHTAKCNVCDEHCVEQILKSFSQRRCSHRHNWKNMTTSKTNDRAALKILYANKHPTSSKTFEEAYLLTLTHSSSNHSNIDYLESSWVNLL